MNDDKIKVEYDGLTKGESSVGSLNTEVEGIKTKVAEYNSSLDESIFMGPIADSCKDGFINLDNQINSIIENFNIIKSYLSQANANYQSTDSNSKSLFLSIMDNARLTITEGLPQGLYVNPNADSYQVEFINKILPYALQLYKEKGILPSLTIGQACKESAFGTARPGEGYNVFGIKASGWKGKKANASTKEDTGKSIKTINADFRDYDTLEAAVHDYGEVLSLDRYDAVRAAKDYKEAAHAVKAGGYATGRNYDNSLIKDFIEPYNLNQWDPK